MLHEKQMTGVSILVLPRQIANTFSFFCFQDVLHKITQDFGNVLRIVIFKKHGVQAMVEYPFPNEKIDLSCMLQ